MKKILISLLVLMLSLTAFSQAPFYYDKQCSQIENFGEGRKTIGSITQKFIDTYGTDEFHAVLNNIEAGTIDEFIRISQEKGIITVNEVKEIKDLILFTNYHFSFVANGKLFVMTYEPYVYQMDERKLNLYRRDDDGWKIASEVRTDYWLTKIGEFRGDDGKLIGYHNETTGISEFWHVTKMATGYGYPNFGSVNRVDRSSVIINFSTITWIPEEGREFFDCLVVFTPNSSDTYIASYFEPKNRLGKIVKKENLNYEFIKEYLGKNEEIRLPILCGTYATAYEKTDDGIKIQYWDGNMGNPIDAGTIELKIHGTYVTASGSIELNKIK